MRQGRGRYFAASVEINHIIGRVGAIQMRLTHDDGLLFTTSAAAGIVSE